MTTFKQFLITEDVKQPTPNEAQRVADIVSRECSTYLKKLGNKITNHDVHLLRGVKGVGTNREWFEQVIPRSDRQPRDTPLAVHQIYDQWFKQNFGFPYRSAGVFATKERAQAVLSGGMAVYYIFPTDPYKILYASNVPDLYVTVRQALNNLYGPKEYNRLREIRQGDELTDEEKDQLMKKIEQANYREVKSPIAVKYGSEVAIQCERYYMVHENHMLSEQEGSFVFYLKQNMGLNT